MFVYQKNARIETTRPTTVEGARHGQQGEGPCGPCCFIFQLIWIVAFASHSVKPLSTVSPERGGMPLYPS